MRKGSEWMLQIQTGRSSHWEWRRNGDCRVLTTTQERWLPFNMAKEVIGHICFGEQLRTLELKDCSTIYYKKTWRNKTHVWKEALSPHLAHSHLGLECLGQDLTLAPAHWGADTHVGRCGWISGFLALAGVQPCPLGKWISRWSSFPWPTFHK